MCATNAPSELMHMISHFILIYYSVDHALQRLLLSYKMCYRFGEDVKVQNDIDELKGVFNCYI